MTDALAALDERPPPGKPREYDFPPFERKVLDNGLTLVLANVPGRPLLQAQLLVRGDSGAGATTEHADRAGSTVMMARAMSEGTQKRDAIELVEAGERLGAELGADAGWDSVGVHVEVPQARLGDALALLAELALEPSFPEHEIERLRDERLNDLQQAMADPRRRVDRAFPDTVYAESAAYGRSLSGSEETIQGLDREILVERHRQLMRPDASTMIVSGDLKGVPVDDIVASTLGGWQSDAEPPTGPADAVDGAAKGRRVLVVDRPGAPQSEVRVGHVGTRRKIDDFHAISVMNALLGGLFNSRLNRLLREERGYTYGVHSGFDMRRSAGPFAVRCAVESDVTAPAIIDIMAELERIREAPVEPEELDAARDYLVGVFPLRFETSAQVAGALGGLVIFDLPDDELDRYRPTIAAVSADAVLEAARKHIEPERASIVVVGDASKFVELLGEAGFGDVEVVTDEGFGADAKDGVEAG